jgi:hypothetical protein
VGVDDIEMLRGQPPPQPCDRAPAKRRHFEMFRGRTLAERAIAMTNDQLNMLPQPQPVRQRQQLSLPAAKISTGVDVRDLENDEGL